MSKDRHGWVGVDLDGCLAEYHGWTAADNIGQPIARMIERVKEWLDDGDDVRIFTARGSMNEADRALAYPAIERWCETHIGRKLAITNIKDVYMIALYDDRAFRVDKNAGHVMSHQFIDAVLREVARARQKFPSAYGCMCALTEEVGELAKAAMDESPENVFAEAVQVAAMAMRVATEGDASLTPVRERRGQTPSMVMPDINVHSHGPGHSR